MDGPKCTYKQEAPMPQRYHVTHHVSKLVLCFEVWELARFQTAKVTFKVIQWHWQWCHSIGHIRFPMRLPFQPCLYLAPFPRYHHLFLKLKQVT